MQISHIILAYFVIGAVMFGGGAVNFDQAGVANFFLHKDSATANVQPAGGNESPAGRLTGIGGAIPELAALFGGSIIFAWNLFVGLIAYLNWPIILFLSVDAPMSVVMLAGGTPVVMFYMGVLKLVRISA